MANINTTVAEAFEELADLLQIAGHDKFRVLSYRRVAAEVATVARDLSRFSEKDLLELKGIGKATAAMIIDLIETGTTGKLEEARASVPQGVREMTALPGLGPKRAFLLSSELGITSLEELRAAIATQRLRGVKGFGKKTEESLARALEIFSGVEKRVGLEKALELAEELVEGMWRSNAVSAVQTCGSLRRMRETIGDLDLLAAGPDREAVMEAFRNLAAVNRPVVAGTTKATLFTQNGMQIDLRVVAPDEFGAALQYFTGSKEHNVRVREIAVKQGYKLSEYGLFTVTGNTKVAGESEEGIYETLGMQTPPPTIRENHGEIELSLKRQLPRLVETADIRGDLHSHSTYSDGIGDVREMALAAAALGYRYYAITDHAYSHHVRSHSVDSLLRQRREIDAMNEELGNAITVLQGAELDIGPDGTLPELREGFDSVDLVVASIHSSFAMSSEEMTRRIIRALEHPRVNILGHPTGRRIGIRAAVEFDFEAVFEAASRNSVALEINSTPTRLDLKDDHIRLARQFGCRFAIDTDSHAPSRLPRMRLGVGMAQRGWVTKAEVINCLDLVELKKFFSKS